MQDARKSDGLDVSDRISLRWTTADPDLAAALTEHGPLISSEVLAVDYAEQDSAITHADASFGAATDTGADAREHTDPDLGLMFWIRRVPPAPAG